MTTVSQQKNYLNEAQRKSSENDLLFLDMVKDGMTKEELQKNIDRRPALWGKYFNWLEKLPAGLK